MELLKEVSDGLIPSKKILEGFKDRKAARAVLLDNNNRVAIVSVSKHKCHKLPGAGLREGESVSDALTRSLLEETGCEAEVIGEIGMVVEYRHEYNLSQASYGYLAKVSGKGNFSYDEKSNGFNVSWLPINEAIELLEKEIPVTYESSFILKRDLGFLRRARRVLEMSRP